VQDYKSLCAAVTICVTLVYIQTHRLSTQTHTYNIWSGYMTTRSANADCTALRAKRETRIFSVGVGAFKPEFYRNGVIPC